MEITLMTPSVRQLDDVVSALRDWQADDAPLQLHPGDLGWYSMRGAAATAAATRAWSADGRILAVGLLDSPDLLRMAFDPQARENDDLVGRVVADLGDPIGGPLGSGAVSIEARGAERLGQVLIEEHGWHPGDLWTPFHLDLSEPVEDPGMHIETIGPDQAAAWVAVHWSAFRGTPMTDDDRDRTVDRWRTMAEGPIYSTSLPRSQARSLAAFDADGVMVAVITVWPAGPGRPGLIEPMGVHRDHRRHGYGTAITRAAVAALREQGSSSATVCTENARPAAIATYVAAGFTADPPVADLTRSS